MMKLYTDQAGQEHVATEIFAQDGQGILYRTKNERLLIRDSEGQDLDEAHFEDIQLLPLLEIERLILPIQLLKKPAMGYIMQIPENCIPLSQIMQKPEDHGEEFYFQTGGLKRRLQIMCNLVRVFMQLHSIPIVYGAVAPERILISTDVKDSTVYLLYSERLSASMSFQPKDNGELYCAPEEKEGRGGTVQSDTYALIRLCYDLLTLSGTYVNLPDELEAVFQQTLNMPEKGTSRPKLRWIFAVTVRTVETLTVCRNCGCDVQYNKGHCPKCQSPLHKQLVATMTDVFEEMVVSRGTISFDFIPELQCFYNYHMRPLLLGEQPERAVDFILTASKDKKYHMVFKNHLKKPIRIQDKVLQEGQSFAVLVPFGKILLEIDRNVYAKRVIEMTIL